MVVKDKLNIVLITNNFPPVICGVGDYTAQLASTFHAAGNSVSIICVDAPGVAQINHAFNVYPIVKKWNFKGYKTAYKKIKELQPDAVLLQYVPYSYQKIGIPILMVPFLFFIRVFSKTRIISTYHELANGSGLKTLKYFIPTLLQFMVGYTVAIISNRIIFSSYAVKKELGFLGKKGILLPIGSGFNLSLKNGYDSIIPEIKIVSFGLSNFRNYNLYAIVQRLEEMNLPASVVVLGKYDINLRKILEEKSEKNIVRKISFTGIVDNDTIDEQLKTADIFLMQDMVDKYGNGGMSSKSSIVGAIFSTGLPVIGTKGHLTTDYFFKNGVNCVIVNDTAEDVANAVILLATDASVRQKIGTAARKTFNDFFSWQVISNSYKGLIEQ